jgi:hypothetical protein
MPGFPPFLGDLINPFGALGGIANDVMGPAASVAGSVGSALGGVFGGGMGGIGDMVGGITGGLSGAGPMGMGDNPWME